MSLKCNTSFVVPVNMKYVYKGQVVTAVAMTAGDCPCIYVYMDTKLGWRWTWIFINDCVPYGHKSLEEVK